MRTVLVSIMLIATAIWLPPPAGAQEAYVLTPDSRLRIEGTSTVDDFTCEAKDVVGTGRLISGQARSADAAVELTVPVGSFDCGKARMNRDMQDALKANLYPNIEFWLEQVEVSGARSESDEYDLQVTGWLNLAGVTRSVTLDVRGEELPDGRLRARGALTTKMTNFGVTPPTALLGLVRAHDQITVAFDLYGARDSVVHAAR